MIRNRSSTIVVKTMQCFMWEHLEVDTADIPLTSQNCVSAKVNRRSVGSNSTLPQQQRCTSSATTYRSLLQKRRYDLFGN
jgi:hypothetical protein